MEGGGCRVDLQPFTFHPQPLGKGNEPLGGTVVTVQDDVLDGLQQGGVDVVVDLQHRWVDDGHVQAGADGMVEERGVHGLADLVVATEGKRQVAHAAAGLGQGQVLLDPGHGADEVDGVGLVLLQACAHGEDVHVEDDVLRWEADGGQQLIGSLGDGRLALEGGGLSRFVEGHDHHGGP